MNHWALKYVSIQFKPHACVEFCEKILNEEFGCNYNFPKHSGKYNEDIIKMNRYIYNNLKETDMPVDGDIVLMDGVRKNCHVGIFARINGQQYVLHGEIRTGCSCLHKLSDLHNYGYKVSKFLKWK